MAVLENRYEIMALVQAKMCNPNGDPDTGNNARIDFETNQGIITDVSYKARIRAYVEDAYAGEEGCNVLLTNGASLNRQIAEAVLAVNGVQKMKKADNKKPMEAAKWMCDKYWDVRTFGGVLSTGLNAGQVKGAVQIGMSLSVDPVETSDITITRKAFTEGDFDELSKYDDAAAKMADDKKRTMGTKQFIPYGLYVLKATVSANLAEKVGFTEEDLKILLEAIMQMYETESSASKMGMSVLSPVIVFKHVGTQDDKTSDANKREAKLGCAPAYQLFDAVSIVKKDCVDYARDYTDYEIVLDTDAIPNGVEVGFKLQPFADIDWNIVSNKVITVR